MPYLQSNPDDWMADDYDAGPTAMERDPRYRDDDVDGDSDELYDSIRSGDIPGRGAASCRFDPLVSPVINPSGDHDYSKPLIPKECLLPGCEGHRPVKELEYRFCSRDCAVLWALEQAEAWQYCDRCGGWMEFTECFCDSVPDDDWCQKCKGRVGSSECKCGPIRPDSDPDDEPPF